MMQKSLATFLGCNFVRSKNEREIMSLKSVVVFIIALFSIAITIQSCSHYKMGKKETKISKNGDDESHNNGMNCMNCHSTGQEGEGWFNVAGSVYRTDKASHNPDGKIFLFSEPNGKGILKYSIEVDGNGNFYTTNDINFESGLYPAHQNSQGIMKYMESPIISGQCQSCHNVTTDKIWNQ